MAEATESKNGSSAAKWSLLTVAALVGAGALAYFVVRSRQGGKATAVDDLLCLCENFADTLDQRIGNTAAHSMAG